MDSFCYPCGKHTVQPGTCRRLTELRAQLKPICQTLVVCNRYRCGHVESVPCHLETSAAGACPGHHIRPNLTSPARVSAGVEYCDAAPDVPPCDHPVLFEHTCGHTVSDVPCGQAFSWAADEPQCREAVDMESPLCGHSLRPSCNVAAKIRAWLPWGDDPPERELVTEEFEGRGGDDRAIVCPVFRHDAAHPAPDPKGVPLDALMCGSACVIVPACGHQRKVPCARAFAEIRDGACKELIDIMCDSCGSNSVFVCSVLTDRQARGVPPRCTNLVAKLCTGCGVNRTKVECDKMDVRCNKEATATLQCGHRAVWLCGQEDDPRQPGAPPCIACVLPKWWVGALPNLFFVNCEFMTVVDKMMTHFERLLHTTAKGAQAQPSKLT